MANVRRLFACAAAAVLSATVSVQVAQPTSSPLPDLSLDLSSRTRLLVVAPHPDDEALGAAGLIGRVRAGGGHVRVVLLTSGDGFPEGVEAAEGVRHPRASDFRGYGRLRERESVAALRDLGVARSDISFLGFPDEGLCRLASTYLFDRRRAFESPYTGRERPPATEEVVRGARYRGVDVRRELERLIVRERPTLLVLPHPDDEHPDHCSTHIFVREALEAVPADVRAQVRVLHYLVHYGQWPVSDAHAVPAPLHPPDAFPTDQGRWLSLPLSPREAAGKLRALQGYRSQMQVIGRFLLAFGRTNELYLEGEPASPPECWCDGENVAAYSATLARPQRRPAR